MNKEWEGLREAINRVNYPDLSFLQHWTMEDYRTKDIGKIFIRLIGQYHSKILASAETYISKTDREGVGENV